MKYDARKAIPEDTRNYKQEAEDLIRKLGFNDLYKLYEIVVEKQKRANSTSRDKELDAVKLAIEKTRAIDKERLARIYRGYSSSMAAEATPASGYNPHHRKKG